MSLKALYDQSFVKHVRKHGPISNDNYNNHAILFDVRTQSYEAAFIHDQELDAAKIRTTSTLIAMLKQTPDIYDAVADYLINYCLYLEIANINTNTGDAENYRYIANLLYRSTQWEPEIGSAIGRCIKAIDNISALRIFNDLIQ